MIAAITAACVRVPHAFELRACVRDLVDGKQSMMSREKRGRFVWHISKGKIIPSGKVTSKTCTLFGLLDEATSLPVITAVGAHGRGSKSYTAGHWHDPALDCGEKTFDL